MDFDFPNNEAELAYLLTITPSKHTPETVTRTQELREQIIDASSERLKQSIDERVEALKLLLPNIDKLYEVLKEVGELRLPDEPSILIQMAPEIGTTLVNLQANVNVYRMAASAAKRRIELEVDKHRALWFRWSPTEEKFRVEAEFKLYAIDLLKVHTDATILYDDCESAYWILTKLCDQLSRNTA
jgi:hypothetical protein